MAYHLTPHARAEIEPEQQTYEHTEKAKGCDERVMSSRPGLILQDFLIR